MKKTNKLISILLVLAMLLSMAPITVFAEAGDKASVTDKDGNAIGSYTTFADAVTAAQGSEGSTLKLLDKIPLTEQQIIDSGKFTLDLNGKTLLNEAGVTLWIQSAADVTIKDSGEGGTVKSDRLAIDNSGTLTVESGNIISGSEAVRSTGTLTVKGGTFEGTSHSVYVTKGTAEINDGEFNGSVWGFISYNINGGDFTAEYIGINCEGGVLTVKGGRFDIEEIKIFKGIVSLKGGEFTNGLTVNDDNDDNDAEQFANSILAEGYAYYDADGNKITVADNVSKINGYVQVKEYFAASVTNKNSSTTKYKTFADAVTAAEGSEGCTLTLLDDITLTATQYINSGKLTLDLNGKTLFNETANTLWIESGADVTVKDSREGGTVKSNAATSSAILNNGTLTVESGNIISENKAVNNNRTLTVNGGSFEGKKYSVYISKGTTEIYGGEFNGAVLGFAPYTINGGDFTADHIGINCEGGVLTVNGGTFDIEQIIIYKGTVSLEGGEFTNGFAVNDFKMDSDAEQFAAAFLADGYYYKDADGKVITVADDATAISGYAKVAKGADFADAVITLSQTEYEYNGGENKPAVTVKVGGKTLDSANYTVSYADNINAGTATVAVKAKGDYTGETTAEFTITPRPVTITADNKTKTYGAEDPELTYTASGVIPGDSISGNLSRTVGENVGVYGISLGTISNANNPNYEFTINKAYFTVEPDTSGTDNLTVDNVKSSDKAAVEYVYSQMKNAVTDLASDAKKAEWEEISKNNSALRARIDNAGENYNKCVDSAALYDIDTVTSADKENIEYILMCADDMLATDNYTSDERDVLEQVADDMQAMLDRLDSVANEITRIESAINGYDVNAVKSTDKADIEQLIADIKALTDGQNITDEERTNLENLDATADALLAKIAETTAEYERVIAAANGYDKATVTSADKDALIQLDTDIFRLALTNNVTAEEKNSLMISHTNVFYCIQRITYVSDEIKRIVAELEKYVFESVKSSDKADIQQLIADIKALTDTQNITADERALLEGADETADKLIEKIDETVAEINRINDATNAYDIDTVTSDDKADIEKLITDIKVLTDGDNITDTEREQLDGNETTLNALLDKIGATADEIARIENAVNSYDETTVKSTDKADLEQLVEDIKALTDATNITDEERAALEALDANADSLIKKIDDTAAEIARIDEAVNSYDIETVKSSDIQALGKLIEDIKALIDGDNLTEDEKAALEADDAAVDALVEKLTEVAEEIKRVDEAVKSYDEETVKSTDSEDLAQLKDDVQALIDSTNTTDNEKTALGEMIADIEALEDKIEEIENQLEQIAEIENGYDPEKVTSDDKAAVEAAIAEIEAVNPDNLTDEQKAEYAEIKASLESLLAEIEAASAAVDAIGVELEMFDENRVTIFWEDDIEALKAKIDELLADENMGTAEKAKLGEYKAQADKLIEIINNPWEYFSLRFLWFIWDCLTWKYNGILWLFSKIFGC